MKYLLIVFLLLGLSGCSSSQKTIETVKVTAIAAGVATGKLFGIIDEPNQMKKPDYYSTKPIKRDYKYGVSDDIEHLDCHSLTNNCR